nr:protein transport protein SEC24-like At3g07100 [Tanacetum cinerariifolium]
MGTENPNHANNYPRPTSAPFAPPQSSSPFSSSRPVAGSAFRPASVPPPLNTPQPFPSGPVTAPDVSGFRPIQTVRPAPSFGPPTSAPFQRFPTPSPPPPLTSSVGQPMLPPSVRPQMPPMNIAANNNLPQPQS